MMLPSKAKVWIDGELKERPCKVKEVAEKKVTKKNASGIKKDTGYKEVMVKIEYPRNFSMMEQWIPTNRLIKKKNST